MQYVLGGLPLKTIQVIYSWNCIMLQWTGYPLFTQNELYYGIGKNSE